VLRSSSGNCAAPFVGVHVARSNYAVKVWRIIVFVCTDPKMVGIALHNTRGDMREFPTLLWEIKRPARKHARNERSSMQ